MKKHLLFASLLLAGSSFAQLTNSNEPEIGTTATMYLCDSAAPSYSNITGTGVTWDYSGSVGYANETRTLSVVAPSSTPNASSFPYATKAIVMEGFLTTYWTSTNTERSSPGFVFTEPSLGQVKAVYNTDEELLATYPFALNNTVNDAFAGTLSFTFNSVPMNPAATGSVRATIDGQGTLILNGATTHSNVIRYKLIDTASANVPFVGTVKLARTQYEYYTTAGGLPVFTHTYARIYSGSGELGQFTVALSAVEPDQTASVNTQKSVDFNIYPNPAKESLTIQGNFSDAEASIVDQTGKAVKTASSISSGASIDINDLDKGIYFLVLNAGGNSSVQKFTKF